MTAQTVDQSVFFGGDSQLVTLDDLITSAPIVGTVNNSSRATLGGAVPTVTTVSVGYEISLPELVFGDESAALWDSDGGRLVIVRTDDLRAAMCEVVVLGSPISAPADGEVLSNTALALTGPMHRATATRITGRAQTVAVGASDTVWVVVSGGSGRVQRGSNAFTASGAGIRELGGSATSVTIPATIQGGYVLAGQDASGGI